MSPGSVTYELPQPSRWSKLFIGFGINSAFVLLLAVANPQFFTTDSRPLVPHDYHVTLVAPAPLVEPEAQRPRVIATPVHLARNEAPKLAPAATETKPVLLPPTTIQASKPEAPHRASNVPPPPKPAPEKKEVKTDVFSAAASEVTTHQPQHQVQTGGFGDPNGVPVQGASNNDKDALRVAQLGSFDLPAGSGQGNGTGGSHGTSGILRSSGFGDAVSTQASNDSRAVQTGSFGTAVPKPALVSAHQVEAKPLVQPVEIVYKPRPAYTAEARRLKIEGEVLLEVVFTASGSLRINRVVKGLGYGLDDMALAAAQNIQFHPAKRGGQPYDCAALVHFVFELPK